MEVAPEEHAEAASGEQEGGCAEAEGEAEGEVEAEHSKKRRARRTKLEVLRAKHEEMLKASEKLKAKLSDLLAGGRLPTDAALVNITEKISRKQAESDLLKKDIDKVESEESAKRARKEALDLKRKEEAERAAPLTEAAQLVVVEVRLKHDHRIVDSKMTSLCGM